MDLQDMLNDLSYTHPLRPMLCSVAPDQPSLVKLNREIQDFKARIEMLAKVAKDAEKAP